MKLYKSLAGGLIILTSILLFGPAKIQADCGIVIDGVACSPSSYWTICADECGGESNTLGCGSQYNRSDPSACVCDDGSCDPAVDCPLVPVAPVCQMSSRTTSNYQLCGQAGSDQLCCDTQAECQAQIPPSPTYLPAPEECDELQCQLSCGTPMGGADFDAFCDPWRGCVCSSEGNKEDTPPPPFQLCDTTTDQTSYDECFSCLSNNGIWTALGCIPTSPEGFTGDFLQIATGSVALTITPPRCVRQLEEPTPRRWSCATPTTTSTTTTNHLATPP